MGKLCPTIFDLLGCGQLLLLEVVLQADTRAGLRAEMVLPAGLLMVAS